MSSPATFRIGGMTSTACVSLVSDSISSLSTVSSVTVSLQTSLATVSHTGDPQLIIQAVEQAGKTAQFLTPNSHPVALHVAGMSCMGCVNAVKDALQNVQGTSDVHVNLDSALATLQYSGDVDLLLRAVQDEAGKEATVATDPSLLAPDDEAAEDASVVTTSHPVRLKVDGMTCMRCVAKVTSALEELDGVTNVHIDLESGMATLQYPGDVDVLVRAVKDGAGKEVTVASEPLVQAAEDEAAKVAPVVTASRPVRLDVHGMTCMRCVAKVTSALEELDGVTNVHVDLESGMATLQYPGEVDFLVRAVKDGAGKEATVASEPLVQAAEDEAAKVAPVVTASRPVRLDVHGMTCMRCVAKVTGALEKVDGVTNVHVDLESGLATLQYPGDVDVLVRAVKDDAGKEATVASEPLVQAAEDEAAKVAPVVTASRPVRLDVHGMTCMRCVAKVTDALEKVDGVTNVHVDLESGLATLQYPGDVDVLVRAVKDDAGKEATVASEPLVQAAEDEAAKVAPVVTASRPVRLDVHGMTCMRCVAKVTDALEKVDGVTDVHVSLDQGTATVKYAGHDDQVLVDAIREGAGKTAVVDNAVPKGDIIGASPDSLVLASDTVVYPPTTGNKPLPYSVDVTSPGMSGKGKTNTTQLRVGGMTCSSCVGVVEGLLVKLPGVQSARVNLLAGRADVVHDSDTCPGQTLASAVAAAGYECEVVNVGDQQESSGKISRSKFRILFPTDVQAQNALKVLRFTEGVESAEVIGAMASLSLVKGFPKSLVLRALERDGSFGKMIVKRSREAERAAESRGENRGATDVIDKEARVWRGRFLLAAVFMLPIMIIGFLNSRSNLIPMRLVQWIDFALATPVQFVCGRGFYRASYFAMKKRRATMDVLVALSTSVAYFSSVVVVVFDLGRAGNMSMGHSAMFNVSVMIITMVLLGKWVEAHAKRRAAAGVAALSALTPDDAVLFDEKEGVSCHTELAVNLLDVGDVVRIVPGDRIPTDGEVIDGISAVDESMLTGESNPVPKAKGNFVYGGTVNGGGSMLVRTTAVGSDAVLSQIVKLVNDAQTSRAPIESFADRVSAVFVPAVVAVSCVVFIVWYGLAVSGTIPKDWTTEEGPFFFALLFALETMVIACPCALGLATPTAVMVASEVGTGLGVLFRGGGTALEAASRIKTVFFDKTGTLTMGKPEVAAVLIGEYGTSLVEQASVILSDLIHLVESQSHHPLASAITRYLQARDGDQLSSNVYKLSYVEELPGRGMKATVNKGEYHIRVGSRAWAFGENADLERMLLTEKELAKVSRMESEEGLTVVAAVVNDSMVAIYGLEDTVRPEAETVISYLRDRLDIDSHVITGDSEETGRAVARRVGIRPDNLLARAMPWTKVDAVKSLPEGTGCFVGDGINDAPALAAASLGVAIGAGAPVAAENAAVVLVRSDLRGIVNALSLAKATFRRVRLNFGWAIGYNLVGIPLAAGVLYPLFRVRVPPLVASGAMALSSTSVILSSLWLRTFKAPEIDCRMEGIGVDNVEELSVRGKGGGIFEIGDDGGSSSPSVHSERDVWLDVDRPLLNRGDVSGFV